MNEQRTQTNAYPASCPKCGDTSVTLVTFGNPDAPKTSEVSVVGGATIEVTEHIQFLACERCKHSWYLPGIEA